MAKKKILQDSDGQIWPVTVADCVYIPNGSSGQTIKAYTDSALSGKSDSNHTHKYAGSSSAGGAATTALTCTGNSATATTLQTGRTINGTSFNGSTNITTANWGTARTLTIGNKEQSVNGSANVSWALSDIMGRVSTSSSGSENKGKYTKFARIDISGGAYRTCAGTFDFVSVESGHVFGILTYYLRTGSAITSASITLAWKTLTNTAYANSVVAVKVSDGVFDLYYKPINDWDTMSITNINSFGIGYITLYGSQSFTSSVTAAATSSLVNHSATAAKLTTARTITIGSTGKTFDGSGNVSWSLSEIGAAAASHGRHIPDSCTTITDWNSATTTGWYMASGASNAPSTGWYFGEVIAHNTNYVIQTVYQFTASTDAKAIPKYIRAKMNGTWGAWTNVTVAKAVPSNAVFTDTNTWRGIQNNLTSDATDQSLSAAQGKALKSLIDGKAASSHGNHVPTTQTASNKVFLRNDNTWATITPANIGAAASSHGTHLTLGTGSENAYYGDKGNTAYTHSQAAHAPSNAQKNSDITKAEIEAKLTGTVTSHNHSGTYAAASHGTHLTIGTGASNAAAGNHTHSYLPLSGGTITGTLNISPDSIANATFASTYTTLRKPVTMSSDCTVNGSLVAPGGTTTTLLSLTATNAYTEFQYGYGVIRVAEKNHLYLQAGHLVGETASEVRCTVYKKAGEYTNLRAHNLCAQGAVYAQGTNISSDRTLKENIKYISNANTINDDEVTIMECYNFVKDDLGLATYNYINDPEKHQKLGFIAQDLLYDPVTQTDSKIGQLMITKLSGSEQLDPDNPKLTYDVNNTLGVMLGAIQVATKKIESLETIVENLTKKIESLENKSKG